MSTIEVTCNCGRVYVLPGDKEGRKLQCRRCGAVMTIRRDAEPGVVVPFQTPSDEEDEGTKVGAPAGRPGGQGRAPAPAAARSPTKPLDLKPLAGSAPPPPLRRCPRCRLQDDPSVTICVRCGFDFRDEASGGGDPQGHGAAGSPAPGSMGPGGTAQGSTVPGSTSPGSQTAPAGKPLGARPSTTRITKGDLSKAERVHDERIAKVETLAKISFVPLAGLVPGVLALILSLIGNGPIRELPAPSRKGLESRLGAARLMAVATLLIWLGVVAFYVFVYRPQQKHEIRENLAQACHSHLESLGRWIREARGPKGRFPADTKRTLGDGIRDLADQHDLGDAVLSCPLPGGERYAIDGGLRAIEPTTNGQYLILWDSAPHAEADGAVRWLAVRADGLVEEFRSANLFKEARARPSERPLAGADTPTPNGGGANGGGSGGGSGGTAGGGGAGKTPPPRPASEGFEPRRVALLELAKELDAQDKSLEKTITEDEFGRRVGLSSQDALTQVIRYGEGDDGLRHAVARLVARLAIPGPELLRLVEQLEKDADAETRETLMLGLRRAGAPAWLDACAALASEMLPPVSERALALLADEARSSKEGLKRVLLRARDRRQLSKTGPDQPIFALPPDIYPTIAELLDDRDVGAEALAVLSRGGPEVERVIDSLFASTDPHVREVAFRALRSSLAWRDAPRAPLHERLKAETDRGVKAAVLPLLLDTIDAETMKRALEALRESTSDALAVVARRALGAVKDKEALGEMVRELDRPGPSRDEVVSELRRNPRIIDDVVSEALAQRAPHLQEKGQEAAIALAALRIDDVSHRFLLREAAESAFAAAREAAWRTLYDGGRLSEKVRTEVQEEIVVRLLKESEPAVKAQILALLAHYEFRTPATVAALEALARRSSEAADARERAVVALGQSTDPRAVTSLVDVVDTLTGRAKYLATLKLKEVTGASTQPLNSADWRRMVHQAESDVKKKLKDRDDRERSEFRDRQDIAEAHAKELRPRAP